MTVTRGRRGQGEQTREDILAAAEALLLRTRSEEEVSVRAVADAVGVTAPSIYRHFPDKAHLIFEVCARQFARMAEEVAESVRDIDDPLAAILAAAHAYVRFGTQNPEHYRIMFMGNADHTPELYADEQVLETGAFGMLVEMTQRAIDAGQLRGDLTDALAVSHTLWSAIHGVVSLAVARPNMPAPSLDDRVVAMLDVVLHGIARPSRS